MNKDIDQKRSLLYQTGLISLVLCIFIRNTTIDFLPFWLSNIIPFVIFYVTFAIKILFLDKHSVREWVLIAVLILYTVINYVKCDYYVEPIVVLLLTLGSRNIDIEDNLRKYFFLVCAVFAVTIILCLLKIIPDYVIGGRGDVQRHSLGIIYPTDFAAHVFYLVLLYSYLFEKRYNLIYIAVIFVIGAVMYSFTYARLDLILICITPVLFCLFEKISFFRTNKVILTLLFSSIIICCLIAFLTALLYREDNMLLVRLNDLLSGRLYLQNRAFSEMGLSLWGQNFRGMYTDEYFFIDSGFLYILFLFGSIAFILFMYCLLGVGLIGLRNSDYKLLLALALISLSSVIDHHIVDISYNPFIIFFGLVLPGKEEGRV